MNGYGKNWIIAMSLLLATFALAGCGRKGPLEAPSASVAQEQSEPAEAPAPKPDRRFVLEGLI